MDRIPAVRRAILAEIPPLQALGWSVLAVAVPTALRWAIDRGAAGVPFLTYFPAVTLAALFLGWRWGAGVALASAFISNRLFRAEPLLFWEGGSAAVLVPLFVLSLAALVAIGAVARRTVRGLEEAKAREETLNRELLHRVKNMLTTVNAMAVLTARHTAADDFVPALTGRMQALERATGLLGVDENAPCEVLALVETALAPFTAGSNVLIDGPACELPRDSCVPLSLALYELATNATKYGALSVPEGRVSVVWRLEPGGEMALTWRECGGPPVVPPAREGMGTQLLRRQRGLERVALDFREAGVMCTIGIDRVTVV